MSKYQLKNSSIYLDGTSVPRNKLNITDSQILHEIENSLLEEAYQTFYSDLTDKTILDESYFIALHRYTFESLYDWAGEYRDTNMSKGDSQFCLGAYVKEASIKIFDELASEKYLRPYVVDIDKFAQKLAYYKGELIALHPFHELNGRILRLYIDMLVSQNGFEFIDYSNHIDNGNYIQASINAVQFADNNLLIQILKDGLIKNEH